VLLVFLYGRQHLDVVIMVYIVIPVLGRWFQLRPLDDSGRLRLGQDISNMELALQQLCGAGYSSKSDAFAELRALKDSLFIPTGSLAPDSDVIAALKPSTVRAVFAVTL
jgi:hypothetical protein